MLTLQQIKADPALIVERLAVKGFDAQEKINEIIALDDRRRALQLNSDNMAGELKKHAAAIGALMKEGKKDEADKAKALVAELKASQAAEAAELSEVEGSIRDILLTIPTYHAQRYLKVKRLPTMWWRRQAVRCPTFPRMRCPTGTLPRNTI